ncbi:MAG: histidine--tRNA ligase [Deltaproteobacteria bacterium]|nr:histidine--tRNA ligase [Deltaproteobacteria bacterium]
MTLKSIPGMKDILPEESTQWHRVEGAARRLFTLYGYSEIRTPLLEETSLFKRSVGELTDIVTKEMYTFEDKDGGSLTLRPEGTASVVRAAIEHNLINVSSPQLKVYYLGPMYRRERPQKGRFRQFYQIGVENFGSQAPLADAEVIQMADSFFKQLGIKNLTLFINSLGLASERKKYQDELQKFLSKKKEKFCADCQQRITRNPLRVLDCKNPSCAELTKGHPAILNFLDPESAGHFSEVQSALKRAGVPFTVNPKMVRGLDYYQRTVFEFVSEELGAQSTLAAGGRYDSLVKDLGGPDIPGTGFAIGLERLLMLIPPAEKVSGKKVFIAFMGKEAQVKAQEIAMQLRAAGCAAEMDFEEKSLKSQLRRADKLVSTHVIILGEEELKKGEAQVKDFHAKTQANIPLKNLVSALS